HFRRFPHHGVAADQLVCRVPRVDGNWEVECGNHSDHANRVPGFHETVAGTLRRHGLAVKHAGLPKREITNINHFLDFAFSLRHGLSGFDLNQDAQVTLVLSQQFSPPLDHVAAARSWHLAPRLEGFIGRCDHFGSLLFGSAGNCEEVLPSQRSASLKITASEITRVSTRFEGFLDGGKKLVMSLSSHRKWVLSKCL